MNIICGSPAFENLNKRNTEHFVRLYEQSVEDFMKENGEDYETEDVTGKYVVAVSMRIDDMDKRNPANGKYCFEILSVYATRFDQIAELDYCGHISFITVKNKDTNKVITRLYKDDECVPQSLDDWYESEIRWMKEDNYTKHGDIPTKQQIIETIECVIRGYCQNPNLELNIREEDIIMVQGL